jgi:single-strand DNA-binding protein
MSLFNTYNRVTVMGNVTRDIEIRTLQSGTQLADVTIAINDRVKKGEEWVDDTTFIDVTMFGKTAELAAKHTSKGKVILVEGRLKQEKWQDKSTGAQRSKLKVIADSIVIVGREQSDRQSKPVTLRDMQEAAESIAAEPANPKPRGMKPVTPATFKTGATGYSEGYGEVDGEPASGPERVTGGEEVPF